MRSLHEEEEDLPIFAFDEQTALSLIAEFRASVAREERERAVNIAKYYYADGVAGAIHGEAGYEATKIFGGTLPATEHENAP